MITAIVIVILRIKETIVISIRDYAIMVFVVPGKCSPAADGFGGPSIPSSPGLHPGCSRTLQRTEALFRGYCETGSQNFLVPRCSPKTQPDIN